MMSLYQATLKKMLFPVQRSGEDITAEWELFFFILPFFEFSSKILIFSYPKKRKKDKVAARLATISSTRWTGNKLFFKGGLSTVYGCEGGVRRGKSQ